MSRINNVVSASDILNASILIVDDLEADVRLLEGILCGAGYASIAFTTDPHEVCELYRKNRYDLILLDLLMPDMDGFQVMEGLKEIETDGYIPVLMMTIEPDHKLRALQVGARDFVSKPFDMAEVLIRVDNMLEVRLLNKKIEQYSETLESLALHDALTGLPNRRLLMDRLSLAIARARRSKGTMAVMCLDLDELKQVNDTLGHDAGDMLLKMVAGRLVAALRQEDTVARLGGDEFVIVLSQLSNAHDMTKVASKVLQAVSQPYSIRGSTVRMTTSGGVAIYPTHGEDEDTLMKSADLALYDAKHTGKDVYRISTRTDPINDGA
jgi:diguanylate cyclase (GGDEF)-like protein